MMDIKDFLLEADNFISRIPELTTIPVFEKDGKLNISCKTNDNQIFLSMTTKSDVDYKYGEFSFRDWTVISSALHTLSKYDDFNIKLSTIKDKIKKLGDNRQLTNEEIEQDFPIKITFKTKEIELKHFLQKYSAIQKSEQIHKQYLDRKFIIKTPNEMYKINNVNLEKANEMFKVSGILSKKDFSIQKIDNKLYYCLGDVNSKSCDNASIMITENCNNTIAVNYFNISYFVSMLKALNYKADMYIQNQRLYLIGETENSIVNIVLNGKMNES